MSETGIKDGCSQDTDITIGWLDANLTDRLSLPTRMIGEKYDVCSS